MGAKENLEHGARLQLELAESARAVADLVEVATGGCGPRFPGEGDGLDAYRRLRVGA